jgi:hypothetical protein
MNNSDRRIISSDKENGEIALWSWPFEQDEAIIGHGPESSAQHRQKTWFGDFGSQKSRQPTERTSMIRIINAVAVMVIDFLSFGRKGSNPAGSS